LLVQAQEQEELQGQDRRRRKESHPPRAKKGRKVAACQNGAELISILQGLCLQAQSGMTVPIARNKPVFLHFCATDLTD
jgi:hypothetical protein